MNESVPSLTERPALAPVVVFAYMRPQHLRRTVESLLRNPEAAHTHVTVYCDGPKRPEHRAGVEAVRAYVESLSGFATVTRIYQESNLGLAESIIRGVSQALQTCDRVIVLEDDLLLSPHFLKYMNDGLACYQDDPDVASIHGYWYPTTGPLPETFFLKGADCWGWATWSRAWKHFDPDGARLLRALRDRGLSREIDYDGNYPHMRILKRQIAGRNDSWAIRWHVSCYLRDMLTLYPSRSLVDNIGHDSTGTHCAVSDVYSPELSSRPISVERIDRVPSEQARAAAIRFFRATRASIASKVLQRVRHRLAKLQNPARPPQ
jgi:hypothetical protein